MTVSAQISVYPLRQEHLRPAVESVRRVCLLKTPSTPKT
jgi:hypothetical protein